MLHVSIVDKHGRRQLDHPGGPLEFGRVPQPGTARIVVDDPFVSRDQLRITEDALGGLQLENLSSRTPVHLADGRVIATQATAQATLPVALSVGATRIEISAGDDRAGPDSWQTIFRPAGLSDSLPKPLNLAETSHPPTAETLTRWFETVIAVQRSAAGSPQFYDETVRAVVDLVGLDRALVVLRNGDDWEAAAFYSTDGTREPRFSRTILRRVADEGRTFFRSVDTVPSSGSLMNVEAVVASPILDNEGRIVGAVYGQRTRSVGSEGSGIRPLEAQLVQLLAAAVGAGLARQQQEAEATRSRVQFEQFFSSALAQELARDPALLEGRDTVVTVMFSDIRGFSGLSEQLGPAETCRLVADIMERLTTRITQHAGVLVDYVGDGLIAMWNAPAEQPRHAELAAEAALAMLDELPRLNETWAATLRRPLGLGIGLNTGVARVGNIGSPRRFKYGPLGHTVNLASRVESVTKHLGVPILVSGSTRELLADRFATRRICRARVVGIAQPVDLFELHARDATAEWTARRDQFERALAEYEQGHWDEACRLVYPLLAGAAGEYDVPSLSLVGRAVECLKAPPARFDPVLELSQK
jgi:adenylate cyclase